MFLRIKFPSKTTTCLIKIGFGRDTGIVFLYINRSWRVHRLTLNALLRSIQPRNICFTAFVQHFAVYKKASQ